ncbi:MAG: division/cell wall cluster transcriptional repressor MraZ [Pseudomonadota bacterium]
MWQRFTSNFTNKVDAKGRVSLPAPFRKALDARKAEGAVILVPGFRDRRCIEGYSPDVYERFAAALAAMHPSDPKRKKLEYRLMGRAVPLQVDENGRLALPGDMRAAFDIDKRDVVFVGLGDSFQIWEKSAYEEVIGPLMDDEEGDPLEDMPWPPPGGEALA